MMSSWLNCCMRPEAESRRRRVPGMRAALRARRAATASIWVDGLFELQVFSDDLRDDDRLAGIAVLVDGDLSGNGGEIFRARQRVADGGGRSAVGAFDRVDHHVGGVIPQAGHRIGSLAVLGLVILDEGQNLGAGGLRRGGGCGEEIFRRARPNWEFGGVPSLG